MKCKEDIASWYIPTRPGMDYGLGKVKKCKFGACKYILKTLGFREVSVISKYHYVKSFRNMHLSNFQSCYANLHQSGFSLPPPTTCRGLNSGSYVYQASVLSLSHTPRLKCSICINLRNFLTLRIRKLNNWFLNSEHTFKLLSYFYT